MTLKFADCFSLSGKVLKLEHRQLAPRIILVTDGYATAIDSEDVADKMEPDKQVYIFVNIVNLSHKNSSKGTIMCKKIALLMMKMWVLKPADPSL